MNLKPFVNDTHLYNDFKEEIQERIALAQSGLENAAIEQDLFRYQGEIKALRRLLMLREKVNG